MVFDDVENANHDVVGDFGAGDASVLDWLLEGGVVPLCLEGGDESVVVVAVEAQLERRGLNQDASHGREPMRSRFDPHTSPVAAPPAGERRAGGGLE